MGMEVGMGPRRLRRNRLDRLLRRGRLINRVRIVRTFTTSLVFCLLTVFAGGAVHKEIFSLTRVERGRYKGNEWDLLVKPVIEKWGMLLLQPH
jgi:hypothetical protein